MLFRSNAYIATLSDGNKVMRFTWDNNNNNRNYADGKGAVKLNQIRQPSKTMHLTDVTRDNLNACTFTNDMRPFNVDDTRAFEVELRHNGGAVVAWHDGHVTMGKAAYIISLKKNILLTDIK